MDEENYWTRGERLRSLEKWNQLAQRSLFNAETLETLADAGFYFELNDYSCRHGMLRCAYCCVPISNWSPSDDPWMVHVLASPRCLHVLMNYGGEYVCNVLNQQHEEYSLEPDLSQFAAVTQRNEAYYNPEVFGENGPVLFTRQNQQGGRRVALPVHVPCYVSLKGRTFVGPKIPRLSSAVLRRKTLDDVPASLKRELHDVDSIVRSGLYYDAHDGVFRCYYCEFACWTLGYDPWILHAQHSDCFHIILTKGEPYLDQVQSLNGAIPVQGVVGAVPRPENRAEDQAGAYMGPITRSRAKKRREVYTRPEREELSTKPCNRCGGTSEIIVSLRQHDDTRYECQSCIQRTEGGRAT